MPKDFSREFPCRGWGAGIEMTLSSRKLQPNFWRILFSFFMTFGTFLMLWEGFRSTCREFSEVLTSFLKISDSLYQTNPVCSVTNKHNNRWHISFSSPYGIFFSCEAANVYACMHPGRLVTCPSLTRQIINIIALSSANRTCLPDRQKPITINQAHLTE